VLFGMTVRDLDATLARRLEIRPGLRGVYVTSIDTLGDAAQAGFAEGDVILEVNRESVMSVRDYMRVMANVSGGAVVVFLCYVPDLDQRVLRTVRLETTHS
jgi:S1-C subfamily serine protease